MGVTVMVSNLLQFITCKGSILIPVSRLARLFYSGYLTLFVRQLPTRSFTIGFDTFVLFKLSLNVVTAGFAFLNSVIRGSNPVEGGVGVLSCITKVCAAPKVWSLRAALVCKKVWILQKQVWIL